MLKKTASRRPGPGLNCRYALFLLIVLLGAGSALADDLPPPPPPTGPSGAPAQQPEYDLRTNSVYVSAGFREGAFGEAIPGTVGLRSYGMRTIDGHKFLLVWDARGGATGGYAGNEHPGFFFVGATVDARGELGYRIIPTSTWSPYVSAGAQVGGNAVAVPSVPLGQYNTVNDVGGLAGINGVLATRASFGVSALGERNSLLITLFAQEALRATQDISHGGAYTEFGARLQLDLAKSLSAIAEVSHGTTGEQKDPTFGSSDRAGYFQVTAEIRKSLGDTFWVGLQGNLTQTSNTTTYQGSPITYDTAGPLSPSIALSGGARF